MREGLFPISTTLSHGRRTWSIWSESRWYGGVLLALALLFLLLTAWVKVGNALAFDLAMHRAVRPDDDAGPVRFALIGRDMGTYSVLAGALPTLWFAWQRAWRAAALIIGSEIGAFCLNYVLKTLIARTRPAPDNIASNPGDYLFPSTHTVMAVVCYGLAASVLCAVVPRWRPLICAVYAGVICYIGFCLVYLDTHYSTDVVGGVLGGGIWLLLCSRALDAVMRPRRDDE